MLPVTTASTRRAMAFISPRYTHPNRVLRAFGVYSGCTSGIRSWMLHTHWHSCTRPAGNAGSGTMKLVEWYTAAPRSFSSRATANCPPGANGPASTCANSNCPLPFSWAISDTASRRSASRTMTRNRNPFSCRPSSFNSSSVYRPMPLTSLNTHRASTATSRPLIFPLLSRLSPVPRPLSLRSSPSDLRPSTSDL